MRQAPRRKRQTGGCLLFIALSLAAAAPQVSNVRFSQRPNSDTVDVWYDLSSLDGATSFKVTLEVSTDGGSTFGFVPEAVTGDVGIGVTAGDKHIVWDAKADVGKLQSDNVVMQIRADDGLRPPPVSGMVLLGKNAQGCEEYLWLKDSSVVVKIPAGEFWMGSPQGEGSDDEHPQHKVNVSGSFIDKYEVTNKQFARFVKANGYRTDAEKGQSGSSYVWIDDSAKWSPRTSVSWRDYYDARSEDHPVVLVSWNDAKAYCDWAGKRLPTEAEWEKAARGSDSRKYPWGDGEPDGTRCNYADRNLSSVSWADKNSDDGYKFTAPVGGYPAGASPYGVMDMAGNVWEWCSDWYSSDFYKPSGNDSDPIGPSSGSSRVFRGGSWISNADRLRCAYRNRDEPAYRNDNLGFRCARSE